MSLSVPEEWESWRVRDGEMASLPGWNCGFFFVRTPAHRRMAVMVSDGQDVPAGMPRWEQASCSMRTRCPTWEEMAWVKGQLWADEDTVVQYHPPKSEYVNMHPFCLHLWRPLDCKVILPPSIYTGLREDNS